MRSTMSRWSASVGLTPSESTVCENRGTLVNSMMNSEEASVRLRSACESKSRVTCHVSRVTNHVSPDFANIRQCWSVWGNSLMVQMGTAAEGSSSEPPV